MGGDDFVRSDLGIGELIDELYISLELRRTTAKGRRCGEEREMAMEERNPKKI